MSEIEKKKILVFGNPNVDSDNIALKVADQLQKTNGHGFTFEIVESPEGIEKFGKRLLIMDSVQGLDRVELLHGLNKIRLAPRITTHDFDLAFNLKLLEKTKKIEKISIIAVPQDYGLQDAVFGVEALLKKIRIK
ncbi:MAG: hypothetical protein Q7R70_02540 [Candidatus Diapherotrites archaeon]|nr:hypothetical protein [Candidatus Diapherotrites archaeon]